MLKNPNKRRETCSLSPDSKEELVLLEHQETFGDCRVSYRRPGDIRGRNNCQSPTRSLSREPKNFKLTAVNSDSPIDVNVPPRIIMKKMPFYDTPISSVYHAQQSGDKLTAMKQKIVAMGFTTEQALIGLILTDASTVPVAVNALLDQDFPELPPTHMYSSKSSYTGSDIKERHPSLNKYHDMGCNRWPWRVPDEELCALCGLPREIYHKGDYNLSEILADHSSPEEKQMEICIDEEKPRFTSLMCNVIGDHPLLDTEERKVPRRTDWMPNQFNDISNVEIKNGDPPNIIKCGICLEEMEKSEFFLAPCHHYFCRNCLRMHYRVKIMDGDVLRLPCPYLNEANEACEREIEEEEILSFCDEEMKAKFRKFKESKLIQLNANARFCPKPGCEGWSVGSKWKPKLTCGKCGYVYCWSCTNDWHGYFSRCVQSHDGAFLAFTLGKDIQTCPKCRIRIWKNDGCNHMTCRHCKYEFCWLCRGKYTSNHFEPYNLMGCPGALFFPSWLRCPGCCPSSVNRFMIFVCFIGVLIPLSIVFLFFFLGGFLTALSIWIIVWLIVCIPATVFIDPQCVSPYGCWNFCCE